MIQETKDFIERFKGTYAKTLQVKSRVKMLEKLELVEVDEEGKVTIRRAGSATITVSRAGNESYNDTEATVNIIVNKKFNLKPRF